MRSHTLPPGTVRISAPPVELCAKLVGVVAVMKVGVNVIKRAFEDDQKGEPRGSPFLGCAALPRSAYRVRMSWFTLIRNFCGFFGSAISSSTGRVVLPTIMTAAKRTIVFLSICT